MSKSKVNSYNIPYSTNQEDRINEALKLLGLEGMRASFKRIIEQVIKKNLTLYDFLESLLNHERDWKEENRIIRWIQQARFPAVKTLEGFDFSFQPSINKRQISELMSCRFIDNAENVAFFGPPGVGKTHLAIALGMEAIRQGKEVKFFSLSQLIDLIEKTAEDIIARHRLLQTLLRPRLLILDEIDLYETDEKVGLFLSKLLQQKYERSSVIFTSNQHFSQWKVFGNESRAGAIIDRMMHHAEIVYITGESYRMKDKFPVRGLKSKVRYESS